MSKLSFVDKIKIFIEVSKSSYLYLLVAAILIGLGIVFLTTNRTNAERNKKIYIICSIFIMSLLIIFYHGPLGNIFDYMMNNLFVAIYFPNLAIYLAAIIAMNVIVWISIFNFKTSEIIKRVNIIIYILMNYLLALILNIINSNKLDVFKQSSVYKNNNATALIELSSLLFIIWIIFLVLYKIILIYVRKDYKPMVKKVIVRTKEKILPDNYKPITVPQYIYGSISKQAQKEQNKLNPISEIEKIYLETPKETTMQLNNRLTEDIEDKLTLEDYKLLLKMLKEQKKNKKTKINNLWNEKEKNEIIRLEEERKELLRKEKLRIEEEQRRYKTNQEENITDLERLFKGIQ